MIKTANFGFLAVHDSTLVTLGGLAERYFRDDPPTCLIKLRQLAELVAKLVAARTAAYAGERETFEETLRRLSYERLVPRDVSDLFHRVRSLGNAAAHENRGGHAEALSGLKLARQIAVWFHKTYGKDPNFRPGPFVPPPEPEDASAGLRAEIEGLQQKLTESQRAAEAARTAAEAEARERETLQQRLAREAEERAVWEQLAQDAEAAKAEIAARLASLQSEAKEAPKAEVVALVQRGEEVARQIDLDEADTRDLIDQQLRDNGWDADTKRLRYSAGTRPSKGRDMAIAEWPTASGPADYALFAGLKLVGLVEAKRKRKNVSAAIDQAERYSVGLSEVGDGEVPGGPWGDHKVPFVFAANGRPYLKQIETESGNLIGDALNPML